VDRLNARSSTPEFHYGCKVRVDARTTLRSWSAPSRGRAFALIELGSAAFFAAGVAERMIGPAAPWFVLAAILLGAALRAIDLESCALFIPGGAYGTVKYAFGKGPARLAASAALVEGILFAALAASVAGYATATAIGF